jgi:hypothetical protein
MIMPKVFLKVEDEPDQGAEGHCFFHCSLSFLMILGPAPHKVNPHLFGKS